MSCIEIDLKEQTLNEKQILEFLNSRTSSIYWIINQRLDSKYKKEIEAAEEERRRKEEKRKQAKIENPKKLEYYRNENVKVLHANKHQIVVCPKKVARLKQTELYKISLLKRIIDGEDWNGIIYKNYPEESIFLKNEKIILTSQEEWRGLRRMQCEIPDLGWDCDYYKKSGTCKHFCDYYSQCCECGFFIERLEVEHKQYIICRHW